MRRLLVLTMIALFACKDDPKPQQQTKPASSPEPIPTDVVYNSFFASPSASARVVAVGDAGPAASHAKLIEAGAEPRTKLAYAFAAGKARTVAATLTISVKGQGMEGGDQPPIKFTFTATPGKLNLQTGATRFDIAVQKGEIIAPTQSNPQAAAMKQELEKAFVGVKASFDATAVGEVENIAFDLEKMPEQLQQLMELLGKCFELLFVPLANEPVGIGAKWSVTSTMRQPNAEGTLVNTMTLTAKQETTFTVKIDTTRSSKPVAADPQMQQRGDAVIAKGTGQYTAILRLDGVAQKVDGEVTTNVSPASAPTQTAAVVKITQAIESK